MKFASPLHRHLAERHADVSRRIDADETEIRSTKIGSPTYSFLRGRITTLEQERDWLEVVLSHSSTEAFMDEIRALIREGSR